METEQSLDDLKSPPLSPGMAKGIFACVYVLISFLLFCATFGGNMAGTGETLEEAWVVVGIYTAIVAPTGYFCLSWRSGRRGPLHVVGWLTFPGVSGLLLTGAIFQMAEFTVPRGKVVFEVAGRIAIGALALSVAIWLVGRSMRRFRKRPNQTPEPTPMAVTPPAAQEPRQP